MVICVYDQKRPFDEENVLAETKKNLRNIVSRIELEEVTFLKYVFYFFNVSYDLISLNKKKHINLLFKK